MNTIHPREMNKLIENGSAVHLIDVRTPAEFGELHPVAAQNVPLDSLRADEVLKGLVHTYCDTVYVICKTGNRSSQAYRKLTEAGGDRIVNVDGGTDAWVAAGLPVNRGRKAMSLERQVRIAAGLLVFSGVLLGWSLHTYFYALPALVGVGLIFAGITDWCGMGMLLARMPWNQGSGITCKA